MPMPPIQGRCMPLISIVVPSYNEEDALRAFHTEVSAVISSMPDVEA
jgi:hypothetical protein